jgi:signal transduction histidine kinase
MLNSPPEDIETRVEQFVQRGDLRWVTSILARRRDEILANWLDVVAAQPFHEGHREGAVADHIPRLYDAVIAFLTAVAPAEVPIGAPSEDPAVREAARSHAHVRLEQGLEPADVVVEFRLLRQEILAALRRELPDSAPTSDVLAATLLVNDVLDGAITVGLRDLVHLVEAVREDFLATTVHDVRQPLAAIKGSAQLAARLVRSSPADTERLNEVLTHIAVLSDWMAELLDRLRDASRVALHQLDLEVGTVTLTAIIEEALVHMGPGVAQRVRLEIPADLDTGGEWDRVRLQQVVTNLLSNAVKYAPPQSPITISVQGTPDALEFSVHDEGMGIAEADLPRLFQRYRRSKAATERGIEGLGLGLFLSRGIVEAHGGRIWATSPGPGLGSTFHVWLPRHPAALPTPAETAS